MNVGLKFWIAVALFAGCKSRSDSSGVKVDNGNFVLDSGTYMPGVLPIGNEGKTWLCSATAVSDSTLVTAAHCVTKAPYTDGKILTDHPTISRAPKICVTFPDESRACTEGVFFPAAYAAPNAQEANAAYDISVAVFAPGTFKYYHSIQPDETFEPGKKVMIVGYSPEELLSLEFPKRWGNNVIVGQKPEDQATLADVISNRLVSDKDTVAVSPGDSGGPLLNQTCELIAVASRMSNSGYWDPKQPKTSIHVKLAISENKKFLDEVQSNAVRAVFCKSGAACSKTDGFVRVVKVDDANKFPCKAAAEDQDPKLKAALATLAAKRRDEIARYSGLAACPDSNEISKRGLTGGTCFKYAAVERSDQNTACNAFFISTSGDKMMTREEAAAISKVQQPVASFYNPDKARQALDSAVTQDGEVALKSLKCNGQASTGGCCVKAICQKILTFKNSSDPKLGAETACPDKSEGSATVKTWLSKFHYSFGLQIVPPLAELERGPFPCDDPFSLALRKTTGICYQITRPQFEAGSAATPTVNLAPVQGSNTPKGFAAPTSRCWKVLNAVKTSEEVVCPSGLLDEGAETRPNKGSA